MAAPTDAPTVDARPTKRFFVWMLVRDIELVPAIVDLVHNSVDGAKRVAERAAANAKPSNKLVGELTSVVKRPMIAGRRPR